MKTLRIFTILFLCLILVINAGCTPANPSTITNPQTPQDNPVVTKAPDEAIVDASQPAADDALEGDEDSAAQIVEGAVVPPEIQSLSLGTITFDADASNTATAEYFPGQEMVLELTDDAGSAWKLYVPANALDYPQTLSMTALANTSSADIPGSLMGGLLLEPDGLVFNTSATLSISGDQAAGLPFVLTGQNDGSGIEAAYPEDTLGTALISHFSTVFLTVLEDEAAQEAMFKKLDASEKALEKQGREFLKNKDISVPTPPNVPLECSDKNDAKAYEEAIERFHQAVYRPEGELIGKLLEIKRGKARLGKEYDSEYILENRLLTRLVKKVRLLIKTYQGQEEQLYAVAGVALRISKSVELLSQNRSSLESPLFLEEISAWAASLIDGLLDDIRVEHDYRKINAVWKMAYWASLMGGQVQSVEEIMAKMERIFQFDMHLKWEMGIEGESKYTVEGAFPMRYIAKTAPWGTMIGQGRAEMTSAVFESDEDWFVESAPFHVEAIITGFDVCGLTANLTVNRFYPNVENHFTLDSDGEVMEIGAMPLMQIAWDAVYEDRKKTGPSWYAAGEVSDQYTFALNLRNKDVIAVHDMDEIAQPGETGILMSWFSVELTHTPK